MTAEVPIIIAKPSESESEVALLRKFVRITRRRPDGFLEFQFAIGYEEMFVELILSPDAFEDFCVSNRVTVLESF